MKKLIMTIALIMGTLFSQAQINPCDSMTVVGSQYQITFSNNSINTYIDYWCTNTTCGIVLAEDSMCTNHSITLNNVYDTLVVCNTWTINGMTSTCCVDWIWDGTSWAKMMQQPYFCCDSITYWTDQSQGFNVGLDTTGMIHNPDSLEIWWAVCANGMCYTGQGIYSYYPQITTADTVKVGYDVYLYENGVAEVCSMEEWLIFDQNTYSWVLFNMLPTSINELTFNKINDGKIYDIMGREVFNLRNGVIYIRNNKKYILVK